MSNSQQPQIPNQTTQGAKAKLQQKKAEVSAAKCVQATLPEGTEIVTLAMVKTANVTAFRSQERAKSEQAKADIKKIEAQAIADVAAKQSIVDNAEFEDIKIVWKVQNNKPLDREFNLDTGEPI